MDFNVKQALLDLKPTHLPSQQTFPLKPVCIFVELSKKTVDMGHHMRHLAHHHLVKDRFYQLGILHLQDFDKVDWEIVYQMLYEVPRLFQQW
jgi:hypothetical protein